jgi:hypothetical protein
MLNSCHLLFISWYWVLKWRYHYFLALFSLNIFRFCFSSEYLNLIILRFLLWCWALSFVILCQWIHNLLVFFNKILAYIVLVLILTLMLNSWDILLIQNHWISIWFVFGLVFFLRKFGFQSLLNTLNLLCNLRFVLLIVNQCLSRFAVDIIAFMSVMISYKLL